MNTSNSDSDLDINIYSGKFRSVDTLVINHDQIEEELIHDRLLYLNDLIKFLITS